MCANGDTHWEPKKMAPSSVRPNGANLEMHPSGVRRSPLEFPGHPIGG